MKVRALTILIILLLSFCFSVEAQRCESSHKFYVRDNQGNLIKGVKFEFSEPEEGITDRMERFLQVDKDDYTIYFGMDRPTPEGNKLLKISAEGFEPFEREFYFQIGQYEVFNLTLKRNGSCETTRLEELVPFNVHVEDKDEEPVSGLKVILKSADGKTFKDKTGEYGSAHFEVLEGKYDIEISGGDKFTSVRRKIEVSKKDDDLKILLEDSSKPNL
jgi:hypothetical protein